MSLAMGGQQEMVVDVLTNGPGPEDLHRPSTPIEALEIELPHVGEAQIPLGDLMSRVMQSIFAELTEMAETMPSMSDTARKKVIADWVVQTKRQVVKLYAVAKWSRDADVVQKCMNIIAFILMQKQQITSVGQELSQWKDSLGAARVRNHDLLTSLDVLTTGTYLRLPTTIKKNHPPPPPLTDDQVKKTLADMEGEILYRLRMSEYVPIEMSHYHMADGRVHFSVPKLFNLSLCCLGPGPSAPWFFGHIEFLINVGGDLAALQEFPRIPPDTLMIGITEMAVDRLQYYLLADNYPDRPKLPDGVVDTPLVRVYNLLQMISLSYQLEILSFQSRHMRQLGWAEYLSSATFADKKSLKTSYWLRPQPQQTQTQNRQRIKPPAFGGTLTIAIEDIARRPSRTPRQHIMARLQQQVKLGNMKPSDEVEKMKLQVTWEPSQGVLGLEIPPSEIALPSSDLEIDADNIDFEALLNKVIDKHISAILRALTRKLQEDPHGEFAAPGVVIAEENALHIRMCAEEIVTINIDRRTGRLNMREINGLVVAGRAPRLVHFANHINQNPEQLIACLSTLRRNTIIELAEQKAQYLGLQYYRTRPINHQPLQKYGPYRGVFFIRLAKFPAHYLLLLVKTKGIAWLLVRLDPPTNHNSTDQWTVTGTAQLVFDQIYSEGKHDLGTDLGQPTTASHNAWSRDLGESGFDLTTNMIKALYDYCCARVAYINVYTQLSGRILTPHPHGTSDAHSDVNVRIGKVLSPDMARTQSSLARTVPALRVEASQILQGHPAEDAAMPNIRIIPINWWSDEPLQVITCVKLKYVQQPVGKNAQAGTTVIRPSKRIIYDTKEAVVSFVSENVNNCVGEFLEEWARVSKMVVIAREIAQMSKDKDFEDVRLLSFDLQTVEFAYAPGYSVFITCENQLEPNGGTFHLRFSRFGLGQQEDSDKDFNPHDDVEEFLSNILRQGHGRLVASLRRLVIILRDTLPIAVELERIRQQAVETGFYIDTFAKTSGWYRLLYPDMKHALDFRLMSGHRMAILDASHPLMKSPASPLTGNVDVDPHIPRTLSASTSSSSSSSATPSSPPSFGLQPIPGLADITKDTVATFLSEQEKGGTPVVDLSVGIVCPVQSVGMLARGVHEKIVERLKATSAS